MANIKDFATALIATAPSPTTSGTSIVLESGKGARMPAVPFNATVHPDGQLPTLDNAERVSVTAISTDTLTIVRAQGGTTAKSISAGWRLSNAVFTDDIIMSSGWTALPYTGYLSYSSWDSSVMTGVMSTTVDLTGVIGVGMKMSITQATGGVKYFIVTAISSSTITGFFGTDYTLTNESISNILYSTVRTPVGFPMNPAKWSIISSKNVQTLVTGMSHGSWVNIGSWYVDFPIGVWYPIIDGYFVHYAMGAAITWQEMRVALSTSTSSPSDTSLMCSNEQGAPSSISNEVGGTMSLPSQASPLAITSKTRYYAIVYNSNSASTTANIMLYGDRHIGKIGGVCAYL